MMMATESEGTVPVDGDDLTSSETINVLPESDEEAEGDEISPAELVNSLMMALQNEYCAPCLLPHKSEVLEMINEQIEGMEENFVRCSNQNALKISLHRMETQRLAYAAHLYARKRLKKLEEFPEAYIAEHEERLKTGKSELLSEMELKFAKSYASSKYRLLEHSFLGALPPSLQRSPRVRQNCAFRRVFAKSIVNQTIELTTTDPVDPTVGIDLSFEPKSIFIVPYETVANLIEEEKVCLI